MSRLFAFALGLLAAACAPTEPSTAPSQASSSALQLVDSHHQSTVSLDLVVAFDNSVGMESAARRMKEEFPRLLAQIKESFDVQLAFVTRKGASATRLNPSEFLPTDNVVHLDSFVGSTNALALLAAASCPAESTHVSLVSGDSTQAGKICDVAIEKTALEAQHRDVVPWYRLPSFVTTLNSSEVKGALQTFYRQHADKIFLVVSNGTAQGVTATSFSRLPFNTTQQYRLLWLAPSCESCWGEIFDKRNFTR